MTAGRPTDASSLRSRTSLGTSEAAGLRLVSHHDLAGNGDGMQLLREGDVVYVGHNGTSGMGTSIVDVSDPAAPELVAQWAAPEWTHTHKVQIADGLLLINHEKFPMGPKPAPGPHSAGLAVYRLDDPLAPEQVGFWSSTGRGVHRIVYTGGRYAHMSAIPDGFSDRIWVVVDLEDPSAPGRGRALVDGGPVHRAAARRRRGRRASASPPTTRSSTATAPTSASTTRT